MPKQNIKDIYHIRSLKWNSTYKIKVSENTHSIGSETKTIELLNFKDINMLRNKEFKILHIRVIHVAVKPLT